MKTSQKTSISILAVLALASLLAQPAAAQVSGAVNAATNAAANATAAQNAAAASAQQAANASAQAAASASQAARQAAQVSGAATTNAAAQADRSGAMTGANAAANGQLISPMGAIGGTGAASASLDPSGTLASIDAATRDARATVLTQVEARIEATSRAMDELRRNAGSLQADARARADTSYNTLRAREASLRSSINDARRADADTWINARNTVASNFRTYSQAVADTEIALGGSGAASTAVGPVNGMVSGSIGAALSAESTVSEINATARESRDSMLTQVSGKVEAAAQAAADLRRRGNDLRGDARAHFDAAYNTARDREKILNDSIAEARRAGDSAWTNARAKVASDYQAYAQAMADAELSAQLSGSAAANR